ncbi:hypothetical protein JTE90_024888 [Oedothorax gibbosus]|uniref:MADF domain-containing protein n=1 Tax=Oedothorax gibbosus TaxID=931172 RepID=A0AAV6V2Z1_9ARAC|nr:hypothetical protein JTE90_024888 [Oedothorax gibbosus]
MSKTKVDAEKLLSLVKARPDIYDVDAKCHYHVDKISKLWAEIAEEMGLQVTDCKMKWHSLRTSYARYLRELRKIPESGSKKPNWHLSEAMSFLEEHTLKKPGRSIQNSDAASTSSSVKEEPESPECCIQEDSTSNYFVENNSDLDQRKHKRKRSTDVLADPMLPFVESVFRTNASSEEDPMEHFFKGIRPDVNMLDDRRKLKFKAGVLKLINELMEEQELEFNFNT